MKQFSNSLVTKIRGEDEMQFEYKKFSNLVASKVPVSIFLVNGIQLQGVITEYDKYAIVLDRDGESQLIYKHAISTISKGK